MRLVPWLQDGASSLASFDPALFVRFASLGLPYAIMKLSAVYATGLAGLVAVYALPGPSFVKRAAQFLNGQPGDGNGRGGPILGTHSPLVSLALTWRSHASYSHHGPDADSFV